MNKTIVTAVLAALVSLPASAAMPSFYVGAGTGYTTGNDGYADVVNGEINSAFDGFEGGVFAGARYGFTNTLALGIETGFDLSNADGRNDGIGYTSEKKHSYYVELQPVVSLTDQTAIFGNIGWQRAKFEIDAGVAGSDDGNLNGVRFGGGVEQSFGQHLKGRLEVNHVNYQEEDVLGVVSFDPSETTARIGVSYGF